MGDLEDRLATLEEENRRLKHALRVVRRRTSGRKIRPGTYIGDGRIFGYTRASSDRQEDSVPMQEDAIRRKVATLPGQLVEIFADEFVSATETRWCERAGFVGLMEELRPGDRLIMTRMDLIERNPFATLDGLRWLWEAGVRVHILEHGGFELDLDSPLGLALVPILAEFTHQLVSYRREAVRQSIRWRKERGLAYNKTPELGKRRTYKRIPDLRKPGETKRQGYDTWDPEDCDVIREIWRRHELEGETLYSIARDLKVRAACRWDGTPWVPDGCRRRPGTKKYPFSSRAVQRAYWRHIAMLAAGKDLQDLPANPQHTELARDRIRSQRQGWTRTGQPGRVPKEVQNLLEQNNLDALSEITPRSWQERLYPGPGQ